MKHISLVFVFMAFMEGVFGDEVSVSVTEGGPVTLKTDTEIKTDDMIDWRFGGILIARIIKASPPPTYGDVLDGKFNGRLTLDSQTGDLTISNIKTSDSGVYKVSNSIDSLKRTFNVSVSASAAVPNSGLSSGAIAGIVIGVIAAVAAAVGGGAYGWWKKGQMSTL